MDFKQLNFMLYATIKDLLLLLLRLSLAIHLEGSLLLTGIQQLRTTRMILSHSYSLSTSKQNILLLKITSMLSIAIHHMVLDLVMGVQSLYLTTRIVTLVVMLMVVMHTTSLRVQMAIIQY
jgi:hypothetical protein